MLAVVAATAATPPVLGGYDMVAYWTVSQPKMGVAQFNHTLDTQDCGAGPCRNRFSSEFWFSSAANRDAFAADPWSYAPKYGGF